MKVTVLGTGGWGLTLGQVVYENKNELTFWTNSQAEVDLLSTEHQYKDKLPGVIFPADFKYTTDMHAALEGCDMVLIVVPSQFMASVAYHLPYESLRRSILPFSHSLRGVSETSIGVAPFSRTSCINFFRYQPKE